MPKGDSFKQVLVNLVIGPPGMVIGASAATLATLVLFALHYPRQEVLLAFVLPVQIRWVVIFIIAADLLRALSARAGVDVGVAFAAHLGGIVFALLYWKSNLRLAPWFHKVSPVRTKSGGGPRRRCLGGHEHQHRQLCLASPGNPRLCFPSVMTSLEFGLD